MSWLAFVKSLVSLTLSLVRFLETKQLLEAGEARAIATQLESSVDACNKARLARDAALQRFNATGGVPDEQDPNLRD